MSDSRTNSSTKVAQQRLLAPGLAYGYPKFSLAPGARLLMFVAEGVPEAEGRESLAIRQARQALAHRGLSVRAWARKHNFSHKLVYQVLQGRCKGSFGQSHRIAVLLGIKDGEIDEAA